MITLAYVDSTDNVTKQNNNKNNNNNNNNNSNNNTNNNNNNSSSNNSNVKTKGYFAMSQRGDSGNQ